MHKVATSEEFQVVAAYYVVVGDERCCLIYKANPSGRILGKGSFRLQTRIAVVVHQQSKIIVRETITSYSDSSCSDQGIWLIVSTFFPFLLLLL